MGLDLTSFDAALKQHYTDERVHNMVYKDNPAMALMSKTEDFTGKNMPIPIIYGNPQGRSASFARAQARSGTTTKVEDFILTRVKDYGVATIDNETLEASKGHEAAFLEASTTEIDGVIQSLTRSAAQKMYRSGFGDIGQVGSFLTTTITLLEPEDVVNFEIGQELTLSISQGANATKAYGSSTNGLIITEVNRNTGVLTFGFNVNDATNGIPTIANNDFIFVRGDRDEGATPARLALAGFEAWVPSTDPTSTLFFGVNRAVDVTRLGGLRANLASKPIEEALIEGAVKVSREGGKIDHAFMSFAKYSDLEKALGSKVQYVDLEVGEIGFRGIRINGPKGEIKVVPDQNCPNNRCFMLQLDVWKIYSLGKFIRVIDTDGLQMLRQGTADGVEIRYGYYANQGCRAPGFNINCQI